MKDKISQKTEDEVLDQTFGGDQTFDGFDEEMTTQIDGVKTGSGTPEKKKSSGSNNTLLFVAGGVAAVGILGYIFVLKPMLSPTPVPAKPPQQPVQQPVIIEQAPVITTAQAVVPVVPVAPVVAVAPVAPVVAVVTSDSQIATDFLTGKIPVQAPVLVAGSVLVVPPVASPVVPSVIANVPVITALPVISEVSASNAPSAETVKELVRKFDNQSQQFRIALDDVGSKVTGLEKFRTDQLSTNKNVDERLTKLEGEKVVKVTKTPAMPASTAPVFKRSPVKVSKSVREIREPRDYRNIIVDKTEDRSPKDTKAKEPSVDYNVHSIYGGRIWLKNSDGSLSTYTSGDRLPSGELIKSVDDEKYLINTDKRSFSKK